AGWAYRQLENRAYDSIILLGPSHFAPVNGIAVATEEAYETPLGVVSIDGELRGKIRASHPAFVSCQQAFSREHSLEVQLPFLQLTASGTPIVPLALHQPAPTLVQVLAETLVSILSESKVLVIASSDLSHYYPAPIAEKLDRHALQRILDLDAEGLLSGVARNECQLCGAAGVAALVQACTCLGNVKTKLLSYSHSGMITGDHAGVVGYGAVAFYR
ncbi:MAG: AmmeMemoRadiSam system protein B, partial [Armatimonadetes bacterium]|nr:AmmeMemoRadiSam system protein B [Armatimonadota bacterium]